MRVIFDKEIAEKKTEKYKKYEKVADIIMKFAKFSLFPFLISFIVLWFTKTENYNGFYKVLGTICFISMAILLVSLGCIVVMVCALVFAYQNDSNTEYYMLTKDKKVLDNELLFTIGNRHTNCDKLALYVTCEDKNNIVTKAKLQKNFKWVMKSNINEKVVDLLEGVVYCPYKETKESV